MNRRKWLPLILAVCLLIIYLGGCGTSQHPSEPTTPQITEPPIAEPTAPDRTLENNPFVAEDFVKDGDFISCTAEKTAICVDVSRWQEDIDWEKLKAAGIDYVMIRAAFRGTGLSGKLVKDSCVDQHYAGAKAAGLKVGFYFFSQANSVEEAKEEARFLLDIVKDWDVDLPLTCDWEYFSKSETPRVHGMTTRQITDCIKAFCDTVQAEGYLPMVYLSEKSNVFLEELASYGLWYADYKDYLSTAFRVDMWQYSFSGKVDGISGNVDMNVIFLENSIFAEN